MFSPTGAVDGIYIDAIRYNVTDTIYLLVGKNGLVANDGNYIADNRNVDTQTNYQDLGNRWVTINPQTGAVQTEPLAAIPTGLTDTTGHYCRPHIGRRGQRDGRKIT